MKFTLTVSPDESEAHTSTRIGHSVTQCGRYIFVLGGRPSISPLENAMLDVVEQEWHPIGGDIFAHFHTSCLVDDKIISIGGLDPFRPLEPDTFAENYITIFDAVQRSIVFRQEHARPQRAVVPAQCRRHTAEFFERKREIVIFGGRGEGDAFLDQLYGLKVDSMEWRKLRSKGQSPGVQSSHVSCKRNDKMFVFCNYEDPKLSDLFVLDYAGSSPHWSVLKNLGASPPGLFGGSINLVGRHVILFGGYLGGFSTNDLYVYDMDEGCWFQAYYGEFDPEKAADRFNLHAGVFAPFMTGRQRGVYMNEKIRYFGGAVRLTDVLELDLRAEDTEE